MKTFRDEINREVLMREWLDELDYYIEVCAMHAREGMLGYEDDDDS